MFYTLANAALRVLLPLLARWEIVGLENVPRQGPLIVIANHLSFLDPPVLGAALPVRIVFMSKVEAAQAPFLGLVVKWYGAFPVRRGEVDRQALRLSFQALRAGQALGILPEGTRSRVGRMQRARPGVALIALRAGAPILPVAITGTETAIPQWRRLRRPHIRLVVGKSFCLEPGPQRMTKERLVELSDEAARHIAELLPPEYQGYYGGQPLGG
ncbi:MAG: lysophospholipid acyltransferase family protein [Chloroflexota bacterium]